MGLVGILYLDFKYQISDVLYPKKYKGAGHIIPQSMEFIGLSGIWILRFCTFP